MKKLYYFSRSRLQFVEIKNYKAKLISYFLFAVIVFSSAIFGGFALLTSFTSVNFGNSTLNKENRFLKEKILELSTHYNKLNNELDSLTKINNTIRIAADLPPVSKGEEKVGVGGGYFNNALDFLKDKDNLNLKKALSVVDQVTRKVEFEKANYLEIEKKLKENKKLYECMPAIKPCDGPIGDGFGMRLHPILKIWRMHEGVDILVNTGTPVYAPGKGVVEFVGHKSGLGLCIEINHGFGYKTIYGHLSKTLVREHQRVNRGDIIAKSGDTGLSTGPHLHYEVEHDGVKQNPIEFFFNDLGFFELTSKSH